MAAPVRHRLTALLRGALALAVLPLVYWRLAVATVGAGMVVGGLWAISPPLALIVFGVGLLAIALFG
jgi:hypothetical protein